MESSTAAEPNSLMSAVRSRTRFRTPREHTEVGQHRSHGYEVNFSLYAVSVQVAGQLLVGGVGRGECTSSLTWHSVWCVRRVGTNYNE
jgi:hypothetical protein